MKSQLKGGAILSYLGLFINSAISLVYIPIMLQVLGKEEYGLYILATSVVGFLAVLNFGLGNALIRYSAKYRASKDYEGCYNLYGMCFLIYSILGVLAFGIGMILINNIDTLFSLSLSENELKKIKILMMIMIIGVSAEITFGIFNVIVLAHEKFIFQKALVIITSLLNPILVLPLLLLGYNTISMAVVTTSLSFFTIVINMYFSLKIIKVRFNFKKFDRTLFKEILTFSVYIFLNLIIDKIYWSTDQLILGVYSGTAAIAIYTIGTAFTGYFLGFSSAISNLFLTRVTTIVVNGKVGDELSNLFIKVGRIQYIIISFVLCGFIVLGEEFISLWVGEKYENSYLIALLILIPLVSSLIQGIGGTILQAKNMHKFKSMVFLSIAIMNVVLSLIFVQFWGAVGAALATGIAFTLGNTIVMNVYYWKKIKIDIPRFWKNILMMSMPMIISVILINKLNSFYTVNSWGMLIVKILVFSMFYISLMWYVALNNEEKALVSKPVIKLISKPFNNRNDFKVDN
ncbi:oligosaccharide flippase family protein [Guptibacillus sedimenti]|uniref:oligosaccharide flippase family protein n=1 Tax=Guptibacillus sedimenti TaxID=3025680 RepID=UPI00235E3970|nr:oligosaccharide flippase family protein [Pseudalkalibacillus sedimenti]